MNRPNPSNISPATPKPEKHLGLEDIERVCGISAPSGVALSCNADECFVPPRELDASVPLENATTSAQPADAPENDRNPFWKRCENCFQEQNGILWTSLSRAVNLLAVLNISLFFLTDAVRSGGYYFPILSLIALAVATLLMLLPLGWHDRLGFYLLVLAFCGVAGWLLGASILYWIQHGITT